MATASDHRGFGTSDARDSPLSHTACRIAKQDLPLRTRTNGQFTRSSQVMPKHELAQRIEDAAHQEWANKDSISCKNRASIPEYARRGFAVLADFGGLCVLAPTGRFRILRHHHATATDAEDFVVRAALRRLATMYPALADLVREVNNLPETPDSRCSTMMIE